MEPASYDGAPDVMYVSTDRPARAAPGQPRHGDAVKGRVPSVSDLLARRAVEMAGDGPARAIPDVRLHEASDLGLLFASWDRRAALPTIRMLREKNIERSNDPEQRGQDPEYSRYIGLFTTLLARSGDRATLDEFARWVRTTKPETVRSNWAEVLRPFWTDPDHPAIAEAARALFLDPGSPWLPLVPRRREQLDGPYEDLIVSPMLANPTYRQAVLNALADRGTVGRVLRNADGMVDLHLTAGLTGHYTEPRTPVEGEPMDKEMDVRACDYAARMLMKLPGAPEYSLTWPEDRRDRAVAACIEYPRRYGERFSAESPAKEDDAPQFPRAQLRFPTLGRPATAEDVRQGRAIFSLEGRAAVRVAPLAAGFPARARWVAPKGRPIDSPLSFDGGGAHDRQDGWVWQSEEVVEDGRAVRFCGFAGQAGIARVPAAEIDFPANGSGEAGSEAARSRSSPLTTSRMPPRGSSGWKTCCRSRSRA